MALKRRFPLLHQILQIEKVLLVIMMLALLTVGNLVIPVAFLCRRIYANQPFPWNWVLFFPVQITFGFICAVGSILFLQLTTIDPEPFWILFRQIAYLAMVVVVVSNVIMFTMEEFHKKLRERNEQLEQTVEKGTLALQQQEEELKRAREIQQMLLPNKLPQFKGAQIAVAWQPAREVGGDYFDVIQLDEKRLESAWAMWRGRESRRRC